MNRHLVISKFPPNSPASTIAHAVQNRKPTVFQKTPPSDASKKINHLQQRQQQQPQQHTAFGIIGRQKTCFSCLLLVQQFNYCLIIAKGTYY